MRTAILDFIHTMKRILIFLLFFAAIARGQTYTFKQGESVSILFVFDSTYNPNRIDDIAVAIGSKSVGSLADGKIQTTANTRQFKLQLTSAETKNSFGGALIVSVEDSILGVKKVDAGQIKFVSSSQFNNSAVNTGTDLTVSLEIEEAGITSNATLATIFKGDKGDTGAAGAQGAAGANAQNPNFSVSTGAAGSNVSVSGSYPNLTLTIPRGDTGATGAAGSDASVTSGNIASALGYTPVSPTQLGAKQDTSASITTSKISDWTAAWAARFAAQSTSNLAEGTNLYHTTERVQAVGDARYLPLTGGVLSNASTYQLRLAYDASNHATFTAGSNGALGVVLSNPAQYISFGGQGIITSNVYSAGIRTTNSTLTISPASGYSILFQANGSNAGRVFSSGNWAIGSDTDAGFKFDVNGTARIQGNATFSSSLGIGTTSPTHALTFPSGSTGIAIHNQSDQTTNFEAVRLYWSGNTFNFTTARGGTGITRPIRIEGQKTTIVSTLLYYDFTGNGLDVSTSVPISSLLPIFRVIGSYAATSGIQRISGVVPTINQSNTAGYTANYTSIYEQNLGSGRKLLMDLGVNSAANGGGVHTSRFSVDNTGKTTASSDVEITDSTKGIILKSPDGTQYRITVANGGILTLTAL